MGCKGSWVRIPLARRKGRIKRKCFVRPFKSKGVSFNGLCGRWNAPQVLRTGSRNSPELPFPPPKKNSAFISAFRSCSAKVTIPCFLWRWVVRTRAVSHAPQSTNRARKFDPPPRPDTQIQTPLNTAINDCLSANTTTFYPQSPTLPATRPFSLPRG